MLQSFVIKTSCLKEFYIVVLWEKAHMTFLKHVNPNIFLVPYGMCWVANVFVCKLKFSISTLFTTYVRSCVMFSCQTFGNRRAISKS